MMYPRLVLLKQFMREDGTIFVSIDDNELGNTLGLLDEIFGRSNRLYVVTFKQGSATGHKSINPGCVSTTNFIVMYSRRRDKWSSNKVFTARGRDKRYSQFIVNRKDHFSKWQFVPLMKAFADKHQLSERDARKKVKDDPDSLEGFVLDNADSVIRLARPSYKGVSEEARNLIDKSRADADVIFHLERENFKDFYFVKGERILFYRDKLKLIDGELLAGEPLTTLWDNLLSNNIHAEGGVAFPKGKKPESLIKRVFELATNENDIVMDSFGGSGTTGAVAQKMNRKWIMVEMQNHAVTHIVPRMKAVTDGEQGGISKVVQWAGGSGFRFCKLSKPLFDKSGSIGEHVSFSDLAAHVYFTENGSPIPKRPQKNNPLLDVHQGKAVYLLYNGVLGDKRPEGGNVLTHGVAQDLPEHPEGSGPRLVYGEACRLGAKSLASYGITFKQVPYELKVD